MPPNYCTWYVLTYLWRGPCGEVANPAAHSVLSPTAPPQWISFWFRRLRLLARANYPSLGHVRRAASSCADLLPDDSPLFVINSAISTHLLPLKLHHSSYLCSFCLIRVLCGPNQQNRYAFWQFGSTFASVTLREPTFAGDSQEVKIRFAFVSVAAFGWICRKLASLLSSCWIFKPPQVCRGANFQTQRSD